MPVIESRLHAASDTFQANRTGMLALLDQVRAHEARAAAASGAPAERFAKRGQLLPRERIALLLTTGAPFLPLASLAGLGARTTPTWRKKRPPGGGLISGIGQVSGVRCTVSAPSWASTPARCSPWASTSSCAQEIALENKLPYVQLVESAAMPTSCTTACRTSCAAATSSATSRGCRPRGFRW